MDLLLTKTPPDEIKNSVLPMVYRALEAPSIQTQELCLNIIPPFANLIDYPSMKRTLIPRIKNACLQISSLAVCVNSLVFFMGILGIYKCTFTHKLGITKEQLAGKSEHKTKLEQFHIMQEQQKSLDIGNQMNVSGETKVTNILNQQIDKVVNHIGADLLTGSDSENKEDGLQNKRKTASLTFEEKQKLAKEQEQAQKLKSQQPLKPQVHTPIATVKQTNDLTDTLMDNMSSLTSLSVSTPKPSASSTFTSLPSMGIGMMFSIPVDNTKKNLTNGLNANMGFQTSEFSMPVTTNQNFYSSPSTKPKVSMNQLSQQKPNQWLNQFVPPQGSPAMGSSVMGTQMNMIGQSPPTTMTNNSSASSDLKDLFG
uniref:SCY1 like pseudokinase 2 n=1 Tax=Rhinopithecus roxellana TaxID=61622 RepID=A0A2K6R0P6_RHIRO